MAVRAALARVKRVDDYALIGDGETAALVARNGSIEWLCMPRFDSEACFAALLGDDGNGCWRVAAEGEATTSRRYRGETLILETIWRTAEGEAAVIDFMPIRGEAPDIIRIVEGRRGSVACCSKLTPRFDHGRVAPLVHMRSDHEACAIAGPNALILRADAPIEDDGGTLSSRFTVREGEQVAFAMTWFPSHEDEPDPLDPPRDLDHTEAWWKDWMGKLTYRGPHRDVVARSLLTLKALIYAPTGAIIAAPTSSLPEQPGGARNWDYRFCWLRDAAWTLLILHHAGYTAEARAWIDWLRRTLAGEPVQLQPIYTIEGRRHLHEEEADWLSGFNGARPVRLGNKAAGQQQLDIYGEVLDTLLIACRAGEESEADDALFRLLPRHLEAHWQEPDAGIWESRGAPEHHVYSKVMCWVAFDRAAQWFEHDPDLQQRYRRLADEVKKQVLARGVDASRNCFTRAYGEKALDASALLLPLVGFLPADDPRIVATVAAIEQDLIVDGFVRRYATEETDDGVGGNEGAFLACSCWLANVYILQGRRDEAQALFDRLCASANDVGLLSEEILVQDGELVGNFPQALSHLSLIGVALTLCSDHGPVLDRTSRPSG